MEISIIASSSIDGDISQWDLQNGKLKTGFKTCATPAHGLTSVGGKFLAASQLRNASASSGSIFYWSWTKTQVEVRSFPYEPIMALAANSEGTYLVGGGASGDIYLWEVATGILLKKWHGHYQPVTCLVFSKDDSLLVSGSMDSSVRVWSLIRLFDKMQQGNTLYEHNFNEHARSVTDIVIDYGGCNALIVSASEDRTCKVWSLSKGRLLRSIVFPSDINALALDPGGSVFYAGGSDSKIYIGAMNSASDYGTQMFESSTEQSKAVTCLTYCAEGNLLISGSVDGVVRVWDSKSRSLVRELNHGKIVNNIQVVRKPIVDSSNGTQSSWKSHRSSIPPPLEKYERPEGEAMDGIVIVDPPPSSDVPVYSSFLSADLINELVKELQQQGSAAMERDFEKVKLEYKRSLEMNDQWQKKYEALLQVVMEQERNGGSS